jgi:polysaccharide biosynthesis/export protein
MEVGSVRTTHVSRVGASALAVVLSLAFLGGCALPQRSQGSVEPHPPQPVEHQANYLIGPGDSLQVFVWRNAELSTAVPVRPDGRITIPLVEDMLASGKTPTQLARDIEGALAEYIRDPVVTVMVTNFAGPYNQQIRVLGEAGQPRALPYREHMTLLDVIISVGGLTEYAAGNRASIVRQVDGQPQQFRVRLDDLVKRGDINANVAVYPGDVIIIPESFF